MKNEDDDYLASAVFFVCVILPLIAFVWAATIKAIAKMF